MSADPQVRQTLNPLTDTGATPEEVRDAYRQACLSACADVTGTFNQAAIAETDPFSNPGDRAGTVIAGKYKLLQQIGEGGMGTVWMADQNEPVKRRVAIKLMGADCAQSKNILGRFEAERQAIALMDHPHIARLFDAGTTPSGQPYFIMELVKGVPLTEFCDTHKLDIPQRLNLFTQICAAVQHAHQKGIIHRDLKPSNILVESQDGKPVPKVIDFGLAKATGLRLTEHTLFTAFGSVMGTPLYMAPEQANFNAVDVDTRADIYALGVILYELLTGTTPIARETLKKAGLDEMLKLIREREAPAPSSRLSSPETATNVAANRQMEPAKLCRFMKGELDWIVLKSLAKERERRYETASGFAWDVERFLNHEPVTAGPPTAAYWLRKFVQRNRRQVIAASLVLLALVGGVIGTTAALFEARRQAEIASGKEREANQEKQKALEAAEEERHAKEREAERATGEREAKQEAERNLTFAKKGNEILGSVFEGLDPKQIAESGRPLQDVLSENLSKAVKELEGSAIGEPLEVAAMQNTLGRSLVGLGKSSQAIDVFQKALVTNKAKLGPDHPDTLSTMNNLAAAYVESGQLAKAVPLLEEALEKMKVMFGPDHLQTLTNTDNLALAYLYRGQHTKAVLLLEETGEKMKTILGPDHPQTLTNADNLALAYLHRGQHAKAVLLLEETVEKLKAKLGPDHPQTLRSMNNLAAAYQSSGQLARAVRLLEETVEKLKTKLGPDHPHTLADMNNLATAYVASGQLAKAVPLFEEAMEKLRVKLGPDHPHSLRARKSLDFTRALLMAEDRYRAKLTELGPKHIHTLLARRDMAQMYMATNRFDEAEVVLLEVLHGMKDRAPTDAIVVFTTVLLRQCLTRRQEATPEAWQTFNTQSMLGGELLGQKKYAEAEPLLVQGYEGMKSREHTIPPPLKSCLPEALDRLIELYTALNQPDDAREWQSERAKYLEIAPMPRAVIR